MDTFTLANQQRTPIRARPNEHGVFGQQGNYGSAIDVLNPFNPGQIRASANVSPSYQGGNQSRSAFARAMADTTRTDIQNQYSEAGQEYQQKAQEARASDVASRRDNAVQRYGLERERAVRTKQQDTLLQQRLLDFENKRQIAIKDQRANTLSNIARAAMAVTMVAFDPVIGLPMLAGGAAAGGAMAPSPAAGGALSGLGAATRYIPSAGTIGRYAGRGAMLTGALLG